MELQELMSATEADRGADEIAPCGIHVDEEGEWFYQKSRIHREDILALFFEHIRLASDGSFMIDWKGHRCLLDVADTPFVVSRVDKGDSNESAGESIFLRFRHLPDVEALDPSTLYIGGGNVLYCRVRGGIFPARFSRPAYYQFAEWIEEDPETGGFFIELTGKRWPVISGW